jgi:hemin uptake protein HemP
MARKTKSDIIRDAIAQHFPPDTEFGTTDAARLLEEQGIFQSGQDEAGARSIVASALGNWQRADMIVRGYKLQNNASPGANRRWVLKAVRRSAVNDEVKISKPERAIKRIQQEVVGRIIEMEVVELKPNGEALVRKDGQLYTLKRFNW